MAALKTRNRARDKIKGLLIACIFYLCLNDKFEYLYIYYKYFYKIVKFLATKIFILHFYNKNIIKTLETLDNNLKNNDIKKSNFGLTFIGRWLYSMWIIHSQLLWLALVYNGFSLWTSM